MDNKLQQKKKTTNIYECVKIMSEIATKETVRQKELGLGRL